MPFRQRYASRAAALAVALAAVSACTGTNAVTQSVAGSSGYQAGDQALTWVAPGDRSRVGDVSGELLDGTHFDLSSWRGHVVVVNFWGSWCSPCRDEAQALDQVFRDNRSRGVEFIGVDVREDRASAEAFVADRHIGYPSLFDPSDVLALRFPGLPPNATPTTLIIDRQGRIAARHSGEIRYTQLRDVVARALAEKA
ncbi:MAG TPA: TlpA disulfide reductase family protein [Mycobacteriales bacterium]|nr:TlpA disulfide reductase family protein [Mycobacteriales bacterium]